MRRGAMIATRMVAVAGSCGCAAAVVASFGAAATTANPIVVENRHTGTTGWQLGRTATDAVGQIKGYASAPSVNKGQPITFYVSVNPRQTYTIDVYRMGWYGGSGGRLMQHVAALPGTNQLDCPIDSTTGLVACNWKASYVLHTRGSWTSGIYLAKLTNARGYQNYIMFVVRDDGRSAALLYQEPVDTYEGYNQYPYPDPTATDHVHSHNLYPDGSLKGAEEVTFDRPYQESGASENFLTYEINFLRWLERSGYDVSYSTDVDTDVHGSRLLKYGGFLSVGHDEYWSTPMYDAIEAARDHGVNLAFFGANPIYWQVRFGPSARGVPNRVIICYKDASADPVTDPSLKTIMWRDPLVNRPEQALVGVQYTSLLPSGAPNAAYVVTNSGNWVYAGTGFKDGSSVPGIVGYEADRAFSNYPAPTAVAGTYTLLSHSPFTDAYGTSNYANSSIYQAPSGAWVFGSGTFSWGWALDGYGNHAPVNPGIQRMTANIRDRLSRRGKPG